MMTTTQAAAVLSIKPDRVRQLCRAGVIVAFHAGRDWLIDPAELERVRRKRLETAMNRRRRGRPPNTA